MFFSVKCNHLDFLSRRIVFLNWVFIKNDISHVDILLHGNKKTLCATNLYRDTFTESMANQSSVLPS